MELLELIQSKLPDVRNALPPGTIQAERLEVAFRSAFNKNPKLPECSPMSICAALVNCATLGIIPNTPEQHAYLIPRKNDGVLECNLEIGYRGFTHLILRSGKVSHLDIGVVKKGDYYEFQKGDPVICQFRPNLETPNRGAAPAIAAYCLIVFPDGGKKLELLDSDELKKLEAAMMRQNFNKPSPAWREWPDEMRRKGAIKRIAKTCDLGALVAKAAEMDNSQFTRLPASEPKQITLADGKALPVLPRYEPAQIEDAPKEPEYGDTDAPDLL